MTTSERFDDLAKSLASGLSRRATLHGAVRWAVALVGGSFGLFSLATRSARGDTQDTATLKSLMANPAWTCRSTKVIRLDVDEDQLADSPYPRTCIHHAVCKNAKSTRQFVTACKARGDRCPSLAVCDNETDPQTRVMTISTAKPSPEPAKASNVKRFGSTCRYSWGKPLVLYRKHPQKDYWDTICASPLEGCAIPEPIKGSFVATCKAVGELKERGDSFMLCPAVQDCLANAIPVVIDPPMIPDVGK